MSNHPRAIRPRLSAFRAGSVSPRTAFWSSFVAFFAISGLWAVSNPLMASIDEPSHMVKAVSVVLGAEDISPDGAVTGNGIVEIPGVYKDIARLALCLAFQSDETASCQPAVSTEAGETVEVMTSAINYNPLYYALVGVPVLLPGDPGEHTAYLMRLVSALISSAVLALAVRTVAEMPRRRWLALGLLVPLTPTLVNLTGSINPQSFEVSGSVLLWLTLLALLREPDPTVLGRRIARLVIATTMVAHARGLGPFFVVLIVLLCIGTSPLRNLVDLLKTRAAQVGVLLCVVSGALATAWIFSGNSLPDREVGSGISTRETLLYTIGNTSTYLHQLVAMLGWDDVRFPSWFYMTYAVVAGVLLLLGWSWGSVRDRVSIALVSVLVLVLPVVIQVAQAPTIGWFWQGRYIFPLSIGVSLICALAIERRADLLDDRGARSLIRSAAALLPFLQVTALAINVHRYVNGIDGGWFSLDEQSWLPPIPLPVLGVAYTVAWAALTVVVLRAAAPPESARVEPGVSSSPQPDAGGRSRDPGDKAATASV